MKNAIEIQIDGPWAEQQNQFATSSSSSNSSATSMSLSESTTSSSSSSNASYGSEAAGNYSFTADILNFFLISPLLPVLLIERECPCVSHALQMLFVHLLTTYFKKRGCNSPVGNFVFAKKILTFFIHVKKMRIHASYFHHTYLSRFLAQ